jgi:hypothetical protein
LQVVDEEAHVRIQGVERDAPLNRGFFDVEIPYAEEKMIETSGDLGTLKALELRSSNFAAFF